MNPKVSIIVPVHNSAKFLFALSDNLSKQTLKDWECICINNGSSDNSLSVLEEIKNKDSRFKVFNSDKTGVSTARNIGLQLAQSHYIQFLDADDLLAGEKLEIQSEHLDKHPDTGLVFSDALYFKESIQNISAPPWNQEMLIALNAKGESLFNELLKGNRLVISAPLFRKTLLHFVKEMDTSMKYNEDWDFWLKLAKTGVRFTYLNNPSCISFIRLHPASSSTNLTGMYASELEIYRREFKQTASNDTRSIARKWFYKTWIEIIARKIKGDKISLKPLPKWL